MFALYIVLGVGIAFFNSYSANYYQKIIDLFGTGELGKKHIVIYGIVLLVLTIINYIDEYPGRKLEHGIVQQLKLTALKKISRIDYEYYQSLGTGKLIQRIEQGAEAGKGILFQFYCVVIREVIPSILFSTLFIYRISKPIVGVIFISYFLVLIITKLLLKVLYGIKEKILDSEEKLNHYLVRGFMELVVFRINKRFPMEIAKAEEAEDEIVSSKVKMTMIHELFFTLFSLIVLVIKVGILWYAWSTKTVSVGDVIALLLLMEYAYTPIAIFNVIYVQYKLNKETYARFEQFLDAKEEEQLNQGVALSECIENISFCEVSFSYGERRIMDRQDFIIKQGAKIALVGESGAGKSTLVKLMIGFLKPTYGEIYVNNIPLSTMCLNRLYEHIAYIPQEPPIFDATLRENLIFDQRLSESVILDVLGKVKLLTWYNTLPKGLETPLGEKGIVLSGGERQRLALARLWFETYDLVILDEATSALDLVTEYEVMSEVMNLLKEKTVLSIAHRKESMAFFSNQLYVRKDGIELVAVKSTAE